MLFFLSFFFLLFFFNDTATTEIYTLSLHDALPIFGAAVAGLQPEQPGAGGDGVGRGGHELERRVPRSEEHTSELQSLRHLVCRLLLEKKKKKKEKNICKKKKKRKTCKNVTVSY